ncbi:MAG: M4 family metallopeptidase [Comamonas sp.]
MQRCHFIPDAVLERLAGESRSIPNAAGRSARLSRQLRATRLQADGFAAPSSLPEPCGAAPGVTVFDCKHTLDLPGARVAQPQDSGDGAVQRAHGESVQFMRFLRSVFQRDSLDDAGMALVSSVHYGKNTNNALWNGQQMVYGDGDGVLFVDMTLGRDVIGHELTHGVVQHALRHGPGAAPGWLGEHLADCFGAMFAQWRGPRADPRDAWMIGHDVLGPALRQRGLRCVRDLADPAAAHCLAPQPAHRRDLRPGMGPYDRSGPPNRAFCTACQCIGGASWDSVGQVWYHAMTRAQLPAGVDLAGFAASTRQAAATLLGQAGEKAVDRGWQEVGM